jgi:hypothetical protein
MDSLTLPLFKVIECSVLAEDEVPSDAREFTIKRQSKILQIFGDGRKLMFPLPAAHAENARARLSQWVQLAQDKLAQEIMSQTQIEYPLLSADDNPTNFKGDSDILSAKDILYVSLLFLHVLCVVVHVLLYVYLLCVHCC